MIDATTAALAIALPAPLTVKEALRTENRLFLDTRSPAEFAEDHLPTAINLPILSNEERAVVGTLYRQVSQAQALEKGKEYFQEKKPLFLKELEPHKDKTVIVNCWRGGMRSRVIADLLTAQGYNAFQLEGGYKQYRKYVRERLENYQLKPKVVVLWGLTGVGKTELLKQFPHSLDLEGLAQHRGSLFGALGLEPRSQKRFENLLLQRLEELQGERFIVVEGESRKIGPVQIPAFLYKAMKQGVPVLVKADLDTRARKAVQEYFTKENIGKIKEITAGLRNVISRQKKELVAELLDQKKYQEAALLLLQYYYDPLYEHTLKKGNYVLEVEARNVQQWKGQLANMI
ncbi:MAG: tRNA 2-selenouridine(34) synthase MnmH [Nanoarchaeota archaeon]